MLPTSHKKEKTKMSTPFQERASFYITIDSYTINKLIKDDKIIYIWCSRSMNKFNLV